MTGYTMLMRLNDNSAPAVYELSGREDHNALTRAFIRLTRIMLLFTCPLAVGVVLFNRDLVTCWVGAQEYSGTLLTVTLAVFCVLDCIRGICVLFSFAQGWMRLLTVTALFQGIGNFGLSFLFGKWLGVGGVTLALSIVLLPQLLLLARKIGKTFSVGIIPHFAEILIRLVIPLAAATLAGELVHFRIKIARHHFTGLIAECFVFLATYLLVSYPLAHSQDRHDARRYLSSALRASKRIGARTLALQ